MLNVVEELILNPTRGIPYGYHWLCGGHGRQDVTLDLSGDQEYAYLLERIRMIREDDVDTLAYYYQIYIDGQLLGDLTKPVRSDRTIPVYKLIRNIRFMISTAAEGPLSGSGDVIWEIYMRRFRVTLLNEMTDALGLPRAIN